MTKAKSLIPGLLLGGLLAGGAAAQGVSVGVGASADVGAGVSTGGAAAAAETSGTAELSARGGKRGTLATGGGDTATATAAAEAGLTAGAKAAAIGKTVLSADRRPLGKVERIDTAADGSARLIVALDGALDVPVRRVRIATGAMSDAELASGIALNMSKAEFVAAVRSRAGATAGAGTATN